MNPLSSGPHRRRGFLAAGLGMALVSLAVPLLAAPLSGGTYTLVSTISAGGGIARGGGFALSGWVAAAGAGVSTGEAWELTCGFLGSDWLPETGVSLKVELATDGNVRVWWPANLAGYQLETASSLQPGTVWQAVEPSPVGNDYRSTLGLAARFFRLRKL